MLFVLGAASMVTSFVPQRSMAFWRPTTTSSTPTTTTSSSLFAFQQLPGESNAAFFKRISQLASDSATFERAVREEQEDSSSVSNNRRRQNNNNRSGTQLSAMSNSWNSTAVTSSSGYKKVEEWDEEQREKDDKGEYTWEQRAQFDGQRNGNKYRQNEILRHNLNAF